MNGIVKARFMNETETHDVSCEILSSQARSMPPRAESAKQTQTSGFGDVGALLLLKPGYLKLREGASELKAG